MCLPTKRICKTSRTKAKMNKIISNKKRNFLSKKKLKIFVLLKKVCIFAGSFKDILKRIYMCKILKSSELFHLKRPKQWLLNLIDRPNL